MTRWITGLADCYELYDGFIVDQFGVLHDGARPYPGSAKALRELRARGKRVIVLSNSGKRADANASRLLRLGITPEHYDALLTSGELLWEMLLRRDRPPFDRLGRRLWLGHPPEDASTLDGLDWQPAVEPVKADALLLASLPDVPDAVARLWPLLATGLPRALPLLCANPDLERLTPRGIEPSVGALARRYEAAGGTVVWLGKPHPLVYDICRERLARLGARRLVAIGDSLVHDIGGGVAAGCATCFIAGGLHGSAFAKAASSTARDALLRDLVAVDAHHGAHAPDWALSTLRWGTDPEDVIG